MRVGRDGSPFTVVYFYPKDGTLGCTAEACAFRDVWRQYEAANIQVIGVSNDDSESHNRFANDEHLPFSLVADTNGTWAKTFGVPSFAGFYSRITFLVDVNGVVLKTYRDVDAGLHANQILQDARAFESRAQSAVRTQSGPSSDALAPAPRPPPQTEPSVHLTLQATKLTDTFSGRREFWLGATLTPPLGSHLYWKHSGEVGLPTRIEFTGPSGMVIGQVEYPGPQRITTQHGQVGYGYDGTITIVARVTSDLPLREGAYQVYGSWLSCDVRCVKEQGTATLTYRDGSFSAPTLDVEPLLARLTKPGADVGLKLGFDPKDRVIRIDSTLAHQVEVLDVFPEQDFGPDDRSPERQPLSGGRTWTWRAADAPRVLTVYATVDGQKTYFTLTR